MNKYWFFLWVIEGLTRLKSDEKRGLHVFRENQDSMRKRDEFTDRFPFIDETPLSTSHLLLVVSLMRTPRWQLYTAFMQIG